MDTDSSVDFEVSVIWTSILQILLKSSTHVCTPMLTFALPAIFHTPWRRHSSSFFTQGGGGSGGGVKDFSN